MACGEPISNQVLYEDEVFLAALPSLDRLAPPRDVRLARVGTSALLAQAVGEAAGLKTLADVVGSPGELLRSTTPDERSDTVRSWEPIQTSVRIDEQSYDYWIRGRVARPVGSTTLDWRIEASTDGEAPWVDLGSGAHEGGEGLFTWELRTHLDLLAVDGDAPDVLNFSYLPESKKSGRYLEITGDDVALGSTWSVSGDNGLVWFGSVPLAAGEPSRPGAAQVIHVADVGGRGSGALFTEQGELPFDVCWDANGNDVWLDGPDMAPVGSAQDCRL